VDKGDYYLGGGFLMEYINAFLKEIIAEKLGIEKTEVDPDAAFFALGVTSIISEEILASLHKVYQNLSSTLLFEYPNISKLSCFLDLQERKPEFAQNLNGKIEHDEISDNNELITTKYSVSADIQEAVVPIAAIPGDVDKAEKRKGYDIAIIGLSGKFPKANDQYEYWRNLVANKDCVEEIPKDRWNYLSFHSENKGSDNTTYSKWGGFIDDVDKFDPLFFGISPREAELMDPQQKLFLTCCWEAMEDAGYGKREHQKTRKIGVFAGVTWNEFSLCSHEEGFLKGQYKGPGSLYWGIANRVSYFLDLTGPSIALDTACSSSLVAIHQACQAILTGDCEMALAGGVNLSLHPSKYIFLSDSSFLSTEGKCRSFGEGGDGYVPGEGVGTILLKPLDKAIKDGDYIYGVIRGSATNHGGKTTGYTVPNPESHSDLISAAIERAQIQPEDLTYIECHGTGTALGDPIEVRGLSLAFEAYTKKKRFCGIGSVKSNIGHLEAASGVVGLIKILLGMKYKMIPASIHSDVLNRKIDFNDSPFFVVRDNQEWSIQNSKSLLAGISSFGAGGSNAHLIVESFDNIHQSNSDDGKMNQEMIMLSAQTEVQLIAYANKMLSFVSELTDIPSVLEEYNIRNIAKTLQTGRESYSYRLVVLAASIAELQQNLRSFVCGNTDNKKIIFGKALETKKLVSRSSSSSKVKDAEVRASLWVKGDIQIKSDEAFLKVPLPTYPFLKEKSWITESEILYEEKIPYNIDTKLHPLLDINTSNYKHGRFKKTFSKNEYFLKDHLINNHYVLPGVCHLEMASIGGSLFAEQSVISLKNILFMHPIAVGENPEAVEIEFTREEDDDLHYTIQSTYETGRLQFSQGSISYSQREDSSQESSLVNLAKLKLGFVKFTEVDEFYKLFAGIGIVQKKSFQVIREFFFNENEALSKIALPVELEADFSRYRLHPALMDGAVQTAMAHVLLSQQEPSLIVPFHFSEIKLVKPLTTTIHVHVILEKSNQYKIMIFDDQGVLAVTIKDFIIKQVKESKNFSFSTKTLGTLMLRPCWKEQAISYEREDSALLVYDQHLVILYNNDAISQESIEMGMRGVARIQRCLIFNTEREGGKAFQTYAVQAFEEIQSILKNRPKGKVLIQIVVPTQGEQQLFAGISGLLKTVQLENPKMIGQLIEVESGEDSEKIIKKLKENSRILTDGQIRYQDGKRFVADWSEVKSASQEGINLPWKDRGVYLITGGAGGLGIIFANEIAHKVKDTTLILTGRSPLNIEMQAQFKKLEARVEYRQVDVTQELAVIDLIRSIETDFGTLNGIIHSAGVIRDNFIIKKTKDEFSEVLAPKIAGVLNLDQATKGLSLDFFVLFSSISGSLGNAGQADYSTANTFMDTYAKYRNELVASSQRQGQTLSINWPLWREGGMHVNAETEKTMKESMSIVPMATKTGIWALYQGLASGQSQVMVMEGNVAEMKHKLLSSINPAMSAPELTQCPDGLEKQFQGQVAKSLYTVEKQQAVATIGQDILREKAINYLKNQLSAVIKLPVHRIEANAQLEEYGIDSIMAMKLTTELEKTFGSLPKTLFFEYQNIKELAEYFLEAYRDQLLEILGIEVKVAVSNNNLKNSIGMTKIDMPTLTERQTFTTIGADKLQEKVSNYLRRQLSDVIKLPVHRIEADAQLEKYGIDSIMAMKLTNQLEKIFGSLSKTLFFEYQSITELTGYFIEAYREPLIQLMGIKEEVAATTNNSGDSIAAAESVTAASLSQSGLSLATFQEEKATAVLDIAIIGVSGRYPGARNIKEYWNNLRDGKDCITEIPRERWDHNLYFDEDKNKPGKTYSKWGGFLDGVDQFDPLFFNISPREAEIMDPQERIFLECVYEAIEDAGYTGETISHQESFGLKGNVGVFAGVMFDEYQLYGVQETLQGRPLSLWGVPASIANRVSYLCNFHGPSMTVDTMCSSSLTAIHLACQSLQRGGCELAIAGGVNVSIHPNKYLFLAQGKFLSSKGQCQSFGEGGDGYVPGEGVGALLLKPLSKAILDGDQIYGIIKGTAINHGGKTNGYTVPNPNAQASVIGRAIEEAGIDPRTISYIEAHGTGTSLGDPIEIAGLTKTFQKYTKDKQFCAIGSVKSNIGHGESAAGIAGVTKVLLQIKHSQLVPSLHSNVLNPNIDFKATPFVVQQELTEWQRPTVEINGVTKEYPRIAGISSFGAGGSNAHVVIEEYIPQDFDQAPKTIIPQNPVIIVLSAKNKERLQIKAQQLLAAIQEQQFSNASLADIAYTLQVGREAMEERLALIAGSVEELEKKLKDFAAGHDSIADIYRGQVKHNKETLGVFSADEELQEAISKWIQRKKYEKLLDLWVKGLQVDWNIIYNDTKPRRISLPTYPFVRERYWPSEIDRNASTNSSAALVTAASIHPLLHQNTSNLSEQRFSSSFTGQEFFLADHVVKGKRVMPGAAYLEMARIAVENAAGLLKSDQHRIRLKNIVWARPIIVNDQPVQVHIGLYTEDDETIGYEIYSESEDVDADPVLYSQGIAVFSPIAEAPILDIKKIQKQCSQNSLTSSQCYETFRMMGMEYGSRHQGIEMMYVGSDQILAKLSLPSSVSNTEDQFILHPSMMDSALQASMGLMMGADNIKSALPFALQELEILGKCTSKMWALIRYSDGSHAGDKVQKLNINLCDETGKICVQLKGLSLRVWDSKNYTYSESGGGLIPASAKKNLSLSLDEVLQQVRQGKLDIKEADQLLHQVL
jgi:polyketide synthase PksN